MGNIWAILKLNFKEIEYVFSELQIADGIRPHIEHYSADYQEFKALQYSLFSVIFMNVLGSFLFIVTGWYLVEDRAKVDRAVASNATEEEASA